MNKMRTSVLTVLPTENSISFTEAKFTQVCRQLFPQQLNLASMSEDVVCDMHNNQVLYDMYIGERVAIIGGEDLWSLVL
jgi:hypothetical protein